MLHTFAILLSTLMMVETIGIYLTKDVCDPCGESAITAQLIITELNDEYTEHDCCEVVSQEQDCCAHETHCGHDETHHQHHQEHHFFKNTPVFSSNSNTPHFEAQVINLLSPLVAILSTLETGKSSFPSTYQHKTKIPQEPTLALLCTYLI